MREEGVEKEEFERLYGSPPQRTVSFLRFTRLYFLILLLIIFHDWR